MKHDVSQTYGTIMLIKDFFLHVIKQYTIDIGCHIDILTFEILHSPRPLASVNIKFPGLINHGANLIKSQ